MAQTTQRQRVARAQRHALTKTRTEETEQTVPQHTHMCVELCTQSLEGSEDSLSLLPALLPGCSVCPQSCLCVMAKGIGHLPYKQLTLEGSTSPDLFFDFWFSKRRRTPTTQSWLKHNTITLTTSSTALSLFVVSRAPWYAPIVWHRTLGTFCSHECNS